MLRLLPALLLLSCATAPARGPVGRLHERYVRAWAKLDPNWATSVGLHDHDNRLTRHDDATYAARVKLLRDTLAALRAIEPSDEERMDHRLFLAQLEVEDFDATRVDYRAVTPDLPLGAVSAIHTLLIKDFAPKERRVAHAIGRLRGVKEVCADAKAKLARPPKLWTEMAIDDVEGAVAFLDEVPKLAGEAAGLAEAIASAREAFTGYLDFLRKELLPRSDGSFVYGREAFEFRLKRGHLLALDAEALTAVGEQEFGRTIAWLREIAEVIDPKRDWTEILEEMTKDCPKVEELLAVYCREIADARRFLLEKRIVPIPEETLEVIETPEFERSTTPFAAYHAPAPLDASRLGHFYVTPDPEAHARADIPGTVWHEAYPGHHLQFVYAKDHPSLVRRLNDSPLLSEGWGFYCEELAFEAGYYDDPKERLMQLNWRLQRAARVILDVGIHTGRMGYDEAVVFLRDRVRMGEAQAKASVNAYTRSPTYFSCYMVGMIEILKMRQRLKRRLGERFSLGEFHRRLLECGNVPPALIQEELERSWR
jgi:uncharacterized protein (DUF885 family)